MHMYVLLLIVSEYGGIFVDWDTIWLRSPEHLRYFKYTQVSQMNPLHCCHTFLSETLLY